MTPAQQWQVAARHPKGLSCIIPWEGFADTYRDAARHGGILSNGFFEYWRPRQVESNQYGLPGRASRNWGEDTIEGELSAEELAGNRTNLVEALEERRYRDHEAFASVNIHLEDIDIPLLTVANWGGILLHLRGNVQGFLHAGSELRYIRFIEVELQRSFLDAFCKGDDKVGWSRKGEVPPVDFLLRKGNKCFNNPTSEATFPRRFENEWPIARTRYTDYYLHPDHSLTTTRPDVSKPTNLTALHASSTIPSDLDLFLTLRHLDKHGKEIFYTGTIGDPAPITNGWLRVSLRKTNESGFHHEPWLPQHEYRSSDVQPVIPNDVYAVDVEMWPTNVVVEKVVG
ncbi:hypothetical protein BJX62DRAFT_241631 [Aspergillus germanicus]